MLARICLALFKRHLSASWLPLYQIELGPNHHHKTVAIGVRQKACIVVQSLEAIPISDIVGEDGRLGSSTVVVGDFGEAFLASRILVKRRTAVRTAQAIGGWTFRMAVPKCQDKTFATFSAQRKPQSSTRPHGGGGEDEKKGSLVSRPQLVR